MFSCTAGLFELISTGGRVNTFQLFVLLMFVAILLVGFSQKIRMPYPIALILGGIAIGFNPFLQTIEFDPNLILEIVLPPILYYAAFGISFRQFKRNRQEILSLSLGLVIFTTLTIGILFNRIFPQFPWALAFVFGAIISPPDAVAATTILKRFNISSRLLTVLEGESLVNDAAAIVLYKLGVIALLTGTFSLQEASLNFFVMVIGGIIVGCILGYILQKFSQLYLTPVVGVVFSFTIPYIAFITANFLEVSGVLAVVVTGLIGAKTLVRHHSSLRRIIGFAVWDIFVILLNCFIFILIGLQLRIITQGMSVQQMILYTGYACLITIALIATRMVWVYARSGFSYLRARMKSKPDAFCRQILRESALVGWTGMRGIVSLTVALALPYTLPNNTPLEGRNEVIFIVFVVILLTLLIPSLTLASLIEVLNICPQREPHNVHGIKAELNKAAEKAIGHLHAAKKISDQERTSLLSFFQLQFCLLEISPTIEISRTLVIQEQRKKLLEIWEQLEIDDRLLNQIEHELDLSEIQLARAEIK